MNIIVLAVGLAALGWFLWRWLKRSKDDPGWLIAKWIITAIVIGMILVVLVPAVMQGGVGGAFLVPLVAACGLILAVIWAPNITAFVARPFGSLFDGGDIPPEPQPLYSIAQAKRKQGKFKEAIYETQKQLERFPQDVTGQMFLAEIQAEDLRDLAAAQCTIERFCQQPGHAPKNVSYALNLLADWHLKHGRDLEAARQAFERIRELLPDTEQAQQAAQRLAHLAHPSALARARDHLPIRLPTGVEHVGLLGDSAGLRPAERDPEDLAAELVGHLEQHPLDSQARERLAVLYAEHYRRLDLAAAELDSLIRFPHQPAKQVVHWLNLLADLHIKIGGDYESARQAMLRVIELYPDQAAAEAARRRLDHLRLELRSQTEGPVVKMGTYEQDLGLKGQSRKTTENE